MMHIFKDKRVKDEEGTFLAEAASIIPIGLAVGMLMLGTIVGWTNLNRDMTFVSSSTAQTYNIIEDLKKSPNCTILNTKLGTKSFTEDSRYNYEITSKLDGQCSPKSEAKVNITAIKTKTGDKISSVDTRIMMGD